MITPSTIAASEFGGKTDPYTWEAVNIKVEYPEDYFDNPTFSITGRLPTEELPQGGIIFNGWEYNIEKTSENVMTGANTLTVTITATEKSDQGQHAEGYTESVTVTITGVLGEGYPIGNE